MLAVLLSGTAALAQQTREEALRSEREKKAANLEPYRPGKIERWVLKIENDRLLERVFGVSGDGFHPRVGSFTRGGGIAFGPGYRRTRLFGGRGEFTASTAASLKKYWIAEAGLRLPRLAGERLALDFRGRKRDLPQEDFFGIGPESRRPDRVSYAYRDVEGSATADVRLTHWLTGTGTLRYLTPSIGRGEDPRFLSAHDLFSDAEAPGLAAQPDFLAYGAGLDLDYTEPRGNPRSGGRYLVSYTRFADRDLSRYSFGRVDVDLRQYLSALKQRRVLALRAFFSSATPDTGHVIPFYLQRTLGGSDSLRGFREFRFRDTNLLLLQAEYRFEVFPALDAALFYDAGKVAGDRSGIGLNGLESDYGFGFRFGTIEGVFLRIDAAFGSQDGKHFWFRFGHVF